MRPVRLLSFTVACLVPVGLRGQLPTRDLSPISDRTVEEIHDGLRYHRLEGREAGGDPWSAHLLEIDLSNHEVGIGLALDQIIGQETPSSMVRRTGAAAAVNGGFSVSNDPWSIIHGDPNGFVAIDGVILSEPVAARPALAFCGEPGAQRVRTFTPSLSVGLVPGSSTDIRPGLNRAREADDLVVYTPEWNATTLTEPDGVEVVVREGVVAAVRRAGSSRIPPDGFVLSASGEAAAPWSRIAPGAPLEAHLEVRDESGSVIDLAGCDVTSAGPVVLRGGVVMRDHAPESYREGFVVERHPRTGVGISGDGRTLYLFVIDGRRPGHSVGATLEELAILLSNEGAETVYNLDGGGSSAMILSGRGVLNSPSDDRERRRTDVVLIRPVR